MLRLRSTWLLGMIAAIVITAPACAGSFEPDGAAPLRRSFPANAARALDQGPGFAGRAGRLVASSGARLGLEVAAGGVVHLRDGDGGFEVELHELGARGAAARASHAATYEREGGKAYWSSGTEGVEEWLFVVAPEAGPVASWQVAGATLRPVAGAVELADANGTARLRVSAPAAFGSAERPLDAHLVVRGDTLELFVDGARPGEELLVDPKYAPAWVSAGGVFGPRVLHAMAELPDGEVVVVNGYAGNAPVFDSEIYDPISNHWRSLPNVLQKRAGPTATALHDGRVLVVGGNDGSGFATSTSGIVLANAEISDPLAGIGPTLVAPMHVARQLHTASLLPDGRVLVVGGYLGNVLASFEIYDPRTNGWTLGNTTHGYAEHTQTTLGDGRVLVVSQFAEIFDPTVGTFTTAATPGVPRLFHTATLLEDGQVLVAGGSAGGTGLAYTSAALYDPSTDHWTPTASLTSPRQQHTATRLADGRVLVAGGFPAASGDAYATTEIYDPATKTWTPGPSMAGARADHTAALLPGGAVLVVAGANLSQGGGIPNTADLETAELFSPYLRDIGEPCGAASACESGFCVEGVCCDSACDDSACSVCSLAAGAATSGQCVKLDPDACKAHPCTGDGECDSHHCADGVCCDSKCDGRCETCAVVRGTCTKAPEGSDPHADCAMPGEPTICGPTCDGKGKCTDSILDTPCIPASCSDETHAVGATTCQTIDGGLGCPPASGETTDCAPFKCDPATGTCKESCTSVRDCPEGYVCTLGGSCEHKPKETAQDESGCGLAPASRDDAPPVPALLAIAWIAIAAARRRARL